MRCKFHLRRRARQNRLTRSSYGGHDVERTLQPEIARLRPHRFLFRAPTSAPATVVEFYRWELNRVSTTRMKYSRDARSL